MYFPDQQQLLPQPLTPYAPTTPLPPPPAKTSPQAVGKERGERAWGKSSSLALPFFSGPVTGGDYNQLTGQRWPRLDLPLSRASGGYSDEPPAPMSYPPAASCSRAAPSSLIATKTTGSHLFIMTYPHTYLLPAALTIYSLRRHQTVDHLSSPQPLHYPRPNQ